MSFATIFNQTSTQQQWYRKFNFFLIVANYFLFTTVIGTLISMKQNSKSFSFTVRSVKQDTGDIRKSVCNLENHMQHYNGGMMNLTNYVKVFNYPNNEIITFLFREIISFQYICR